MFSYAKTKKQFIVILFLVISFIFIDYPQKDFYKVYTNDKNTTIHIRKNYKDIIVIEERGKDKFYYSNLQQYLIFSGIKELETIYVNDKNISEKLPKITIKEIKKQNSFN